jgi:hypothetical protein
MDEVSCVRAGFWADQKTFTFVDSLKVHPGSSHGEVDLPLWQCCLADVDLTTSKCRHGNADLPLWQCCLADVESTTSKCRHGNVDLTIGQCGLGKLVKAKIGKITK